MHCGSQGGSRVRLLALGAAYAFTAVGLTLIGRRDIDAATSATVRRPSHTYFQIPCRQYQLLTRHTETAVRGDVLTKLPQDIVSNDILIVAVAVCALKRAVCGGRALCDTRTASSREASGSVAMSPAKIAGGNERTSGARGSARSVSLAGKFLRSPVRAANSRSNPRTTLDDAAQLSPWHEVCQDEMKEMPLRLEHLR